MIVPLTISEANEFVKQHHRHHGGVAGAKFAIGYAIDGEVRAVALVGRPVARHADDGWTLEVNRVASDGVKNACSALYAAAWRAAKAMGYRKMITYTLSTESGCSVKAAGWKIVGQVKGRSWHTPSRPRVDRHPTLDKTVWAIQ